MTGTAGRAGIGGLYGTFAGASVAVLILLALLVWPRGPTLVPHAPSTFETDALP